MLHTVRWGRNERSVENKGDTSYHLEYGNKQHPYNKALFIFSRLTIDKESPLILSVMLIVSGQIVPKMNPIRNDGNNR